MVTLGIDLASQAANTSVCPVTWAEMVPLSTGRPQDFLATLIAGARRAAATVLLERVMAVAVFRIALLAFLVELAMSEGGAGGA
jgi:hypothetical protein